MANVNSYIMDRRNDFGKLLKQQRVSLDLTLQELASLSEVSPSHLGRIERGQRYPSAHILRKIAKPLGFDEDELFTLAGYLSPQPLGIAEKEMVYTGIISPRLDPYVANILSQEPVDVQRAVVGILTMLKSIAKTMSR